MITSEKQLTTKATTDTFEEIYTNYGISVNEEYLAQSGYPIDYPTRWLNDPSQNKLIAIRRLDVTPSTHSFTLTITATLDDGNTIEKTATIDVTHKDSLIKVLNFMCATFTYEGDKGNSAGLTYEYNVKTNELELNFINKGAELCRFKIDGDIDELGDFLKFH